MVASSAFPQAASPFSAVASPIPVPDRNTHIPASYVRNPHVNPENIIVKKDGVPLLGANGAQFSVAQIAEERRWAVQLNGEVMSQIDFSAKLTAVRLEFFQMLRDRGNKNARFEGNPDFEYVPEASKYVSWCVDPESSARLIQIGYDPKASSGAKPDAFYDSEGEKLNESRMEMLVRAYHDRQLRKALKTSEIEEVKAHLEIDDDLDDGGIAAKLEQLTELKAEGILDDTQYIAKVAALTGAAPKQAETLTTTPKPNQVVVQTVDLLTSLCGENTECKGKAGKRMHEMHCKKCKAIIAEQDPDTE
jgi:hypothetical protein